MLADAPASAARGSCPAGAVGVNAAPSMRRPGRAGGFTLLELLLVLVLAAVTLVVVGTRFSSGVSAAQHKGAARQLAAGLRFARGRAIAEQQEASLELNVEQRSFSVSGRERVHRLPEGLELSLFTAQEDLIDEETGTIRFFPDGSSNGGRITVAYRQRKYEVDVSWLTGRVKILETSDES